MRHVFSRSLSLLLAVAIGLLGSPAAAQTPAATIENNGGTVVLEAYADGALLAPGTFGTGTIPTQGAGTRLMWYPAKAAVRGGRVFDNSGATLGVNGTNYWDDTNIGGYSVAMGRNTRASSIASVSIGAGTRAGGSSEIGATAIGYQTTASGRGATALGNDTEASTGGAFASGSKTLASASDATAIGQGTVASAVASTAMGLDAEASSQAATATGLGTSAGRNGMLTAGECNSTSTNNLFVVGNGTYDSGSNSCSGTSDALRLDPSGNLLVASTNNLSDRRLKTAIEPLGSDMLGKLEAIRPVRYEFKNQENRPAGEQIGLIAQDVRKEFPELVSEGEDGILSLSYSKFTAVLLEGIQEQQTQIDRQRAQIENQNKQISELKAENEAIKERLAALEAQHSSAAGLAGPWGLAVVLACGFGGLLGARLWQHS